MYGRDKWISERNQLKRWGYWLFGELHVPGRLRGYHICRAIDRLGFAARPLRVLDAGSGRGDLAIYLAKHKPQWRVTGIDVSPERLHHANAAARQLGLQNLEFRHGDLENLGQEDEYDLIISADVLEHIEQDRLVLRNLFAALGCGGYLIMTSPSVPQRSHLSLVRWRERRIGFHPSDYGHVREGYSKQDVDEKFSCSGGEVVKSYFTFGLPGTLAFDLFFVIGDNRPNPILFALMFPLLLLLARLDLYCEPKVGSAILAIGRKSRAAGSSGNSNEPHSH